MSESTESALISGDVGQASTGLRPLSQGAANLAAAVSGISHGHSLMAPILIWYHTHFSSPSSSSSISDGTDGNAALQRAAKEHVQDSSSECRRLPSVLFSTVFPFPGETVALYVKVPPPRTPIGNLRNAFQAGRGNLVTVATISEGSCSITPKAFRVDNCLWLAHIPTTANDRPGSMPVQVQVNDGRHRPIIVQMEMQERAFPLEHITLPGNKANLEPTSAEADAVQQLLSTVTPGKHWKGPLRLPATGVVTAGYGLRRTYNGRLSSNYFHRGVDYGASLGSSVIAPAGGRVALVGREADGFNIHGNCVGIDHGRGMTSLYLHLSDVNVREGDLICQGDLIGLVGSTGLSTGPHLHWGLYMHGKCVDPAPWMVPPPNPSSSLTYKLSRRIWDW